MIGREKIYDQSADSDLDALQTDVMRFMAIIAFSLLVIFIPLVRAIPEKDTTNNLEVLKKNQRLMEEMEILKEKTASQSKQIKTLKRNSLALEKRKEKEFIVALGRLQGESKKRNDRIQQLQKSLKEEKILNRNARQKLSGLEKNYYEVQLKFEQLKKRYEIALKSKPIIRNASSPPKTEKVPKAERDKPQKLSQKERPLPKHPRKGKSRVIFSSEESLLRLIKNGDVKFYLFTSGKLFESYIKENQIFYRNLSEAPLTQYEMNCALAPASIQGAFIRQLSNILGTSRKCFLTLSTGINENLGSAVSKYKSGRFVIDRNGSVSHESN